MKRILLIRHGQTDWNAEGRWQGHLEVPLNEEGRQQAEALANYLGDHPITAIYSSDLGRARQTAEPLATRLKLPIKRDPRWRELNLGLFQGLTLNEINSKYSDESRQMRENYLDFVVSQGESRRAMMERAYQAFREIADREIGPEIAVVSHGGTIRVLLLKLFDFDNVIMHTSVHNTSISVIEMNGDTPHLLETAITPHLIE